MRFMKAIISLTNLFASISIMIVVNVSAQSDPVERGLKAINEDVIRAQMGFLASDWTEGREAGEKGEYLAGDYIASMLQLYGVKPFGDISAELTKNTSVKGNRSYFQHFTLLKTTKGDSQTLQLKTIEGKSIQTINFSNDVDFSVRFSGSAYEVSAPVVFIGYGYKDDVSSYNDFAKTDVKGKIALKVFGLPKFARDRLTNNGIISENMKTDSLLKALGAIAVLEFLPDVLVAGRLQTPDFLNMSPAEQYLQSGKQQALYAIPETHTNDGLRKITVSAKTANEIIKGSGINISDYISRADKNQQYSFVQLTGKEIIAKTGVITTPVPVRNILGIIEGKNPEQYIVLGAHYDHVGMWNGYIWNGADDNASGTVGIMTIAKAIAETGVKPEKSIIIALWSAEEVGLLGSKYYLDNLNYPLERIKLNLNFDMIARYISDYEPRRVTMSYTDKYPIFKDITVSNLSKYGIGLSVDYQPSVDPPGGSDHKSFIAKGIPVMRFKPGHREDYHMPSDEISTVNWDIMEKIIRISFANIWNLANTEW